MTDTRMVYDIVLVLRGYLTAGREGGIFYAYSGCYFGIGVPHGYRLWRRKRRSAGAPDVVPPVTHQSTTVKPMAVSSASLGGVSQWNDLSGNGVTTRQVGVL